MIDSAVSEGLAQLRAGVDGLLEADLSGLSSVEVTELLSALEVQRRRLDAVDAAVVAEVEARGVAGEYARCSTPELLISLLRVTSAEAKRRVAAAVELGPRVTVTGEPLPPLLPRVSDALREGVVSAAQVGVISRCLHDLEQVPDLAIHEVAPVVERLLVEAAQHEQPALLARTAQAVLARLDPDGAEPNEERAQRRRDFSLHKRADGTSTGRFELTAEATAACEAVFDSLAAPKPAEDGIADDRTAGQRRHDALLDAFTRLLRSGSLPETGGAPATIILTARWADFTTGEGVARTGHGDLWPMTQVRRLAERGAEIVTVLDDPLDGIVAFGRTRRYASAWQRRALAARDGGCSVPDCTVPAAWTEAHHVIPWLDGGNTDLDNMCLVCGYHHRNFEGRGWSVDITDGHPEWTPPAWLDPQQRPRRNTAHHIPDVTIGRDPPNA